MSVLRRAVLCCAVQRVPECPTKFQIRFPYAVSFLNLASECGRGRMRRCWIGQEEFTATTAFFLPPAVPFSMCSVYPNGTARDSYVLENYYELEVYEPTNGSRAGRN